jgi:hypothetical protein
MKSSSTDAPPSATRTPNRSVLLPVCVSFVLGVAAAAIWFHLTAPPNSGNPNASANSHSASGQPAAPGANGPSPSQPLAGIVPSPSPAVIAEVKRTVPDYASMTPAQGAEILRQAALKKFASATKDMETQAAQAETELSKAQNGNSATDQQAAMQHLRQVQADQTAKFQQIAAQLQLQLTALQELKAAATNAAK